MSIIVQKFGGTSVADSEKILAAARKAIRAQQQGHQVVMVVSAMGKNTDALVELAGQISERPPAREMDMLLSTGEQVSVALMAMAIHSLGHKAVSLTGAQIGIRTDSTHGKARIRNISTERMQKLLDDGNVVIAAGFQGIDEEFNITTLGRGGSDTTAVALAAVLRADVCEIYTDVDGVYTTDPRMLAEARKLGRISYDEMLELASLGAGVMHSRSIEFAKKYNTVVHVRSSLTDEPGTMIGPESEAPDTVVCGAAVTKNEARVSIMGVPDIPGNSLEIVSRVAERKVTIDMIVQNVAEEGKADISFTVPREELAATLEAVREAADLVGADRVTHDDHVSKLSAVGLGMAVQSGVANTMFRALADAGVNIQMISTSEIKISVLVDREQAQTALRAVHDVFQLSEPPPPVRPGAGAPAPPAVEPTEPAEVVARLQGMEMEELLIDDIRLDRSQGRITLSAVPNEPGIAAAVFDRVAEEGISVDLIVQSHGGRAEQASLSFSTQREDVKKATAIAEQLADAYGCHVTSDERVAKLSVSGVGLRSHTGVATRMFKSLAEAAINVEMINTSEVRVNVVVDDESGEIGLQWLEAAFADVVR